MNRAPLARSLPLLLVGILGAHLHGTTDFTVGVVTGSPAGQILVPIDLGTDAQPVAIQFDVIYDGDALSSNPVVSAKISR